MNTTNYELTEFSNNYFSIIGKFLYIATNYEKTFRAYFTTIACKYFPHFNNIIPEFSEIELLDQNIDSLLKVYNEIYERCSKFSFNKIIQIYFDKIISEIISDSCLKEKFIKAKNVRNYIAHELCNFDLEETEKDSFRDFLKNEMLEDVKVIIECTLIMENEINDFNNEPILHDLDKRVNEICEWVADEPR